MDDFLDQLVEASSLPLSVVIVGVGPADFSSMVKRDIQEQSGVLCNLNCIQNLMIDNIY